MKLSIPQKYRLIHGYGAYDQFEEDPNITLIGCMAHARRYFDKALDNDKARAEHALTAIQQLYARRT